MKATTTTLSGVRDSGTVTSRGENISRLPDGVTVWDVTTHVDERGTVCEMFDSRWGRDCFARYGYWNETLPEWGDFDMWVRIVAGTGCLGYLPLPTSLHFRANWRKISNVTSLLMGCPELLCELPALRLPPGRNDQESAWSCITKDPDWITSLRLEVDRADELLDEKAKHRLTTIYHHLSRRFSPLRLRSDFLLRQRFPNGKFFR